MIMIARKLSLLRQLPWAATLATGFGTLWFALVIWLATSIQDALWRGNQPPEEDLVVKSDGTLLIQSTPPQNQSLATYRDLSGRVQDAPDNNDLISAMHMSDEHPLPGSLSPHRGWDQRLRLFVDEHEPTVTWFFVHDGKTEGAGYFVGYERESNRRVGFIGLAGFRADPVPGDERIPVLGALASDYAFWSSAPVSIYSGKGWVLRPESWDLPPRLVYVPSGNRLLKIDLAARTVKTVFETAEPIGSLGIPTLSYWSGGHSKKERPILVRTPQKIHVLDHKHNIIRVFTIPSELDRKSLVRWYEIGNGQAITEFTPSSSTADSDNVTKRTVYRIANDGSMQDRFELTLHNRMRLLDRQTLTYVLALGLPVPTIQFVVNLLIAIDQTQSFPAALPVLIRNSGLSLIAVFALSSILALMAWRRSRSFGLLKRAQIAWAVFVLLFGVPAYLGFLFFRRWPIRLPCPNCHAQAPRDRTACAECGTRFPNPSLKGIEIFA
jgi:hypothetical protein